MDYLPDDAVGYDALLTLCVIWWSPTVQRGQGAFRERRLRRGSPQCLRPIGFWSYGVGELHKCAFRTDKMRSY